jgi:hypothetical protein
MDKPETKVERKATKRYIIRGRKAKRNRQHNGKRKMTNGQTMMN